MSIKFETNDTNTSIIIHAAKPGDYAIALRARDIHLIKFNDAAMELEIRHPAFKMDLPISYDNSAGYLSDKTELLRIVFQI